MARAGDAAMVSLTKNVRRMRWWHWLLALVALLVAALLVCELLWWPFVRGPVERRMAAAFGREVTLGPDFGVRVLGSVRMRGDLLVIGPAPDGPTLKTEDGRVRNFLEGRNFALALPYSTIRTLMQPERGEAPCVRSLEVERLELGLVRQADGRANWTFGGPKKPDAPQREYPEFDRLVVRDGTLLLDDAVTRLRLDASARTREGSATQGPAAGTPSASGPAASAPAASRAPASAPPGATSGETGLEIVAQGRYRDSPLQVRMHSSGLLPIVTSTADTPPVPIRLEIKMGKTELYVDGRGKDVLRLTELDGEFRLSSDSLANAGAPVGVTLPATGPFLMTGHIRKQGLVWSTAISQFNVASSRLRGDFRYDPTKPVPELTGTLAGSRLALQDLAPAVGADADKAPPAKEEEAAKPARKDAAKPDAKDGGAAARVLPQREFNLPSLARMNADVEVRLASLDLGTPQLETFKPLHARIVLRDEVLTIRDLRATTSGGELRGTLGLNSREKTPSWNADLRWSGIHLDRFIKARNTNAVDDDAVAEEAGAAASGTSAAGKGGAPARPPASPAARPGRPAAAAAAKQARQAKEAKVQAQAPPYVSGILGGQAQLRGTGRSTAALLASLDGTVQMWVREGRISHLLVELSGIDIAESLGLLLGEDNMLDVRCAVSKMAVKDGVLTPEVGVIDTKDSTLLVGGQVSFDDEKLGLVLRAQPKDFSPLALRSPVRIEGTFGKPEVQLDRTAIGLRAAAAAALAAVTPLAGLLAFIDFGEEEKAVCADAVRRLQSVAGSAPGAKNPPADAKR
jgi:uncharacterized protein involved in outer membrane biogenesis